MSTTSHDEFSAKRVFSALETVDDDDDIDAQITVLNAKKAERERRQREAEVRRLEEAEKQVEEIRAAMTRAAVEKMVAKREAEVKRQAEEVAQAQGNGGGAEGSRGQKRTRSDSCARCRECGVECEWPESGRGKSCLACVAKKAKCGPAETTTTRPKKKWVRTLESDDEYVGLEARLDQLEEKMDYVLTQVEDVREWVAGELFA